MFFLKSFVVNSDRPRSIDPYYIMLFTGRLDILSISLTRTSLDKYNVSQEKLQDLESRIQELNQTFYDLVKNNKHDRIITRYYKETP